MVKNIIIQIDDNLHSKLLEIKGKMTWRDVLMLGIDKLNNRGSEGGMQG